VCVVPQVLPGGRIPADGQLVVGSSYINEAMITGESQPVWKQKGDTLIGGTINTGTPHWLTGQYGVPAVCASVNLFHKMSMPPYLQ
jgi:P-type E1-E2 ATPase